MNKANHILNFDQIGIDDIAVVGGKNASLGEMFQKLTTQGINVVPLGLLQNIGIVLMDRIVEIRVAKW